METTLSLDQDFIAMYKSTNEKLLEIEGIHSKQLDIFKISNDYVDNVSGSLVDENANASTKMGKSYGIFQAELMKSLQKLRGYSDLYKMIKTIHGPNVATTMVKSIFDGDMYLHDSCFIQIPYCWAASVSMIVHDGITYNEQLVSIPPKKRRSFIDMVKEFILQLSHEVAGAVAVADIFPYYAYFVKKELDAFRKKVGLSDDLTYVQLLTKDLKKEIEDDFQSLVHTLNMKLRSVAQSPFTNFSIFDMANLKQLFGEMVYPDESSPDLDLVMEIQKIFCDWFSKGDPNTKLPYRFPVCTLNVRIDGQKNIIDRETFNYFCQINLHNSPFNVYISSGNKIASCCRLLSSYDNYFDSMGNGGASIGSVRVCTINLPRIGHVVNKTLIESNKQNDIEYTKILIDSALCNVLQKCETILRCHRALIEKHIASGFLPFFKNNVMSLSRMFCTFGINGIYECVSELTDDPLSELGMMYYKHILEYIHNYTENASHKKVDGTVVQFNCEEVPAESLASKMALKDSIVNEMKYKIYSNQFVPLSSNVDIYKRIAFEGKFSKYLSGGCITHINMIDKITTVEQMQELMIYIIKSGVEHYAINYNFCVCVNNHITTNKPNQPCKECGEPVHEYTRIIGYFVPVEQFSSDRKKEHMTRMFY